MASIYEKLRQAAKAGFELELRALLNDPECDALVQDNERMTALMWAACYGHETCVDLLLPTSDALAKSNNGWTALMWAAQRGHESCVGQLLPVSDALAKGKGGRTALMLAASYEKETCVGLLLPASDVSEQDEKGRTADKWAADRGHESLARFIDAYALAQAERAALGVAAGSGAPRGRVSRRM